MSAPATERDTVGVFSPGRARILARTLRQDRWWLSPLLTVVGLAAFVIYATIRSFVRTAYYAADYCAYPVASFEAEAVKNIQGEIRGLR